MATITPVRSSPAHNIEKIFWETLTEADTADSVIPAGLSGARVLFLRRYSKRRIKTTPCFVTCRSLPFLYMATETNYET